MPWAPPMCVRAVCCVCKGACEKKGDKETEEARTRWTEGEEVKGAVRRRAPGHRTKVGGAQHPPLWGVLSVEVSSPPRRARTPQSTQNGSAPSAPANRVYSPSPLVAGRGAT
eukprot:2369101-Prymnesium_polylepis.1